MVKDKNKSLSLEVLRFLATGVVCALLDFLVCKLMLALCAPLGDIWSNIISTLCGFIVGVILNYILSTFWVFKNVKDKEKTKTKKFMLLFVIFSAGGLLLSIGTMLLCEVICKNAWGIDITKVDLSQLFTFQFWGDVTFWAYFVSFCIRTLVGLVWNYFTRKKFLYIAPKEEIKKE